MDDKEKSVSENLVNKADLEQEKCQELCDKAPDVCWGYQMDLASNTDSKCVIFNEPKDMVGNGQSTANCYLYRKTEAELKEAADAKKVIAIEKAT